MKYFITGATGFVGKHLFEVLSDYAVLTHGRGDKLRRVIDFKPDYIIHLAAEIYNDLDMWQSNVVLTHNLLEVSLEIPYKAFIYVGSSSEYGRKDHPMKETDYLDPTTMYEATKGAASLLCQGYARTYDKPIMVARPFSLYGRYEPKHRFIPTLIRAAKNNEIVKLSTGVHDFIHIDDFIDGLMLLMKNPQPGEVYNFGTGHQLSNDDVVEIVEKVTGKNIKRELVAPLRSFDNSCWVANIAKAKKLGWRPKIKFTKGIEALCRI